MPGTDDYSRIDDKLRHFHAALSHFKNPVKSMGDAFQYMTEARALLPAATPAVDTKEYRKHQSAKIKLDHADEEIRAYAKGAAAARVGYARSTIKDIEAEISRYQGEATSIHLRAVKNPLKVVRLGFPNPGVVDSVIEKTRGYIKESTGYVSDISEKLQDLGLQTNHDKDSFSAVKKGLEAARDDLEREAKRLEKVER